MPDPVQFPFLIEVMGMVASCATVYAAIRADLATAIAKAEEARAAANKAHERIDDILTNQRT